MTAVGAISELVPSLARSKFLRTRIGTPFFEANRRLWPLLPTALAERRPFVAYGRFLHYLARLRQERKQSDWTCFLRNRAEIDYIGALGRAAPDGARFSIAILGCSSGAEAYSAAFALRDSLDRIELKICASDISPANIAKATAGVYPRGGPETEALSPAEIEALFEPSNGGLSVRPRWRTPIEWSVIDALSPNLAAALGQHDLVIANKFLCHMAPEVAARCFMNIYAMLKSGGVLMVSGVDLDVRSAVAHELGLVPDIDAIEALHNGDVTVRKDWPFEYYGLEPLDRRRKDWAHRYASAFRKDGESRPE